MDSQDNMVFILQKWNKIANILKKQNKIKDTTQHKYVQGQVELHQEI
jgi:hypothetical protein